MAEVIAQFIVEKGFGYRRRFGGVGIGIVVAVRLAVGNGKAQIQAAVIIQVVKQAGFGVKKEEVVFLRNVALIVIFSSQFVVDISELHIGI